MAVKAGESFERNIAYILIAGGLYVDADQPHQVKLEGKVVGDIDILATDPKSGTKIGVSCKNWEIREQIDDVLNPLMKEGIKKPSRNKKIG